MSLQNADLEGQIILLQLSRAGANYEIDGGEGFLIRTRNWELTFLASDSKQESLD